MFFRRREPKTKRLLKKIVVGLIIGSAIASILGKRISGRSPEEDSEKQE